MQKWAILEAMMAEDSTTPACRAEVAAMDAAADRFFSEITEIERAAVPRPVHVWGSSVNRSAGRSISACPELIQCKLCGRIVIADVFPAHANSCMRGANHLTDGSAQVSPPP